MTKIHDALFFEELCPTALSLFSFLTNQQNRCSIFFDTSSNFGNITKEIELIHSAIHVLNLVSSRKIDRIFVNQSSTAFLPVCVISLIKQLPVYVIKNGECQVHEKFNHLIKYSSGFFESVSEANFLKADELVERVDHFSVQEHKPFRQNGSIPHNWFLDHLFVEIDPLNYHDDLNWFPNMIVGSHRINQEMVTAAVKVVEFLKLESETSWQHYAKIITDLESCKQ